MKYIGFEREEEAEQWARQKLGVEQEPEFFRAMAAVDAEGNFTAVAIITNFTDRNADVSIVMDGQKMTPKGTVDMYNGVFGFLFDTLGLPRVTGLVAKSNGKAQKVDEKFGFKLEGTLRKAIKNDEDLLIYGLLAEEYHQHNWYRG